MFTFWAEPMNNLNRKLLSLRHGVCETSNHCWQELVEAAQDGADVVDQV